MDMVQGKSIVHTLFLRVLTKDEGVRLHLFPVIQL